MAIQENSLRKSPFSKGLAIKPGPKGPGIEARDFTGRAMELLQMLNEAGSLTRLSAALSLKCSRGLANSALKTLWYAGMANYVEVASETGVFRLWLPSGIRPPRDPQEACRMAALSIFYALARHEVPGFTWRITRNGKHPVMAEMTFSGIKGPERWLIDAPRQDEELSNLANVYLFPDMEEALVKTPPGKLYLTDSILFETQVGNLKDQISMR